MVLKLSGSSRTNKDGGGGGGSPSSSERARIVTEPCAIRVRAAPACDLRSSGGGGAGESREWVAQVEPGVQITFVTLAGSSSNDLKRIRFSRELFDKHQAQRWWGENYDRIMELYNVRRFSCQALPTPPRSDDGERESSFSQVGSNKDSPGVPRSAVAGDRPAGGQNITSPASSSTVPDPWDRLWQCHSRNAAKSPASDADHPRTTTASSRDGAGIPSEADATEWVVLDEPGVYITVRELADGARELRRVRFSRERFAENNAKLWWETNKERIQAQYL